MIPSHARAAGRRRLGTSWWPMEVVAGPMEQAPAKAIATQPWSCVTETREIREGVGWGAS